MKNQHSHHFLAVLALAAALASAATARAQIAGSTTTMDVKTSQTTSAAVGWSAKKSLIGKFIFNDTGGKVGRVDDLIISPDKNVTYAIVSAGGFVGIGQHDVAIPIREINEISGNWRGTGAPTRSFWQVASTGTRAAPTARATPTTRTSSGSTSARTSSKPGFSAERMLMECWQMCHWPGLMAQRRLWTRRSRTFESSDKRYRRQMSRTNANR